MTTLYDVVIIGGGPGGYKTAELLGEKGIKTALVEKAFIGGTCLNMGCIPFKSYLHTSGVVAGIRQLSEKELADPYQGLIHLDKIREHKESVIKGLRKNIEYRLLQLGVKLYSGEGEVISANEEGLIIRVGEDVLSCAKLVIASGSKEKKLAIPEGLTYPVITAKEMLQIDQLPSEIDIIGAGAIGLEAASFFADSGCRVKIIEAMNRIGGHIDGEISDALRRILTKKGISIMTGTRVKSFETSSVIYENDDGQTESHPDIVLLAVGRVPSMNERTVDVLSLEMDGLAIKIDECCRTSRSNVFACGDVTGKLMLAHTAYQQAKVIAKVISGEDASMDYNYIPRIIYTNPEVLSVGASVEDCVAAGVEYRVASLPMTYSGKYYAENGKDGAKAKLVLDKDDHIIGVHIIGNGFSEFSLAAEMMIANRMTIRDVFGLVMAHPTYSEIMTDLAMQLLQK